jgi:hypothetical protein
MLVMNAANSGCSIDGSLNGRLLHGKVKVVGPVGPKQHISEFRTDLPIRRQSLDVGGGNTTPQMGIDILDIFRGLAVDVAR